MNVDRVATACVILYDFLTGGLYSFIVIDMVYSQICDWLNDFIDGAAPSELIDKWDCEKWIAESEVIEMFTEFVLPTFKKDKTSADAENILRALLWEYYLFRRATVPVAYDSSLHKRLVGRAAEAGEQLILNASEFSGILFAGARRNSILRRSARSSPCPPAKIDVYSSVIRQIYEAITKSKVHCDVGTIHHQKLSGLSSLVDGVVDKGCLLGFQGDISDDDYYCQIQAQMEICDIDVAEVCKYKLVEGLVDGAKFSGAFITEVGQDTVYSPLFTNDDAGLNAWLTTTADTAQVWSVDDLEITTVLRNRRWWSVVGLPAYKRFSADFNQASADPMFLAPVPINFRGSDSNPPSRNSSNSDFTCDRIALFIDEDELYK